jgi:MFS family permease
VSDTNEGDVAVAAAAPPRRSGPLRALGYRDFRLIAIGNMISQLGFWGQYVAVGWAARNLTDSDFLVTVAFAAQWFPALVIGPVAGVLADRLDRRKLVLYGNLAMVLPPFVIGLLVQTHHIDLLNLVLLVILGGIGQAFTQPAAAAYVPALVAPQDLHSAIALNAGMTNSTRVIGPTLAGVLITAWGVAWGFHVNAFSFLAVAVACRLVRTRPPRPQTAPRRVLEELRLGIDYTRQHKTVGRLLLFVAFEAFWNMHAALMPIFARDVLHGGVSTYGLLSSAPGIGFVGAALLTTVMTTDRHRRGALVGSAFGITGSVLLIAVSRSVALTVAGQGVFGLSYMTMTTIVTTMLIASTEDEYRGRVMGVFVMFTMGVYPINSLIAGGLASVLGAPHTVLLCGIALLVFNIVFFATGNLALMTSHRAETG